MNSGSAIPIRTSWPMVTSGVRALPKCSTSPRSMLYTIVDSGIRSYPAGGDQT